MRSILKFLFVVSLSVVALVVQAEFPCDYINVPKTNIWIKFHEVPSSWKEARLRCEMEGAVLASPLKGTLKEEMIKLTNDNNVTCAVFTGLKAIFSQGDYSSIEGVPLSEIPHRWAEGEPDNNKDNGSSCLAMLPDGTIADVECDELFPYFCYKEDAKNYFSFSVVDLSNLETCGTTSEGYKHDSRTGNCYKFHRTSRTWSLAGMTCMAEGGHLAVINSETEANVTKELVKRNQWTGYVFIGFHDWTKHGDWRTVHGTTLEEAGYKKFAPNFSNMGGEFCGAIINGDMLMDLSCEMMVPFICEIVPNKKRCNDKLYSGSIVPLELPKLDNLGFSKPLDFEGVDSDFESLERLFEID